MFYLFKLFRKFLGERVF